MEDAVILIAEDDADDRYLMEIAFKEKGFNEKLHFVQNGIEVLSYLQHTLEKSFCQCTAHYFAGPQHAQKRWQRSIERTEAE